MRPGTCIGARSNRIAMRTGITSRCRANVRLVRRPISLSRCCRLTGGINRTLEKTDNLRSRASIPPAVATQDVRFWYKADIPVLLLGCYRGTLIYVGQRFWAAHVAGFQSVKLEAAVFD